jgi:hypothetical protein
MFSKRIKRMAVGHDDDETYYLKENLSIYLKKNVLIKTVAFHEKG